MNHDAARKREKDGRWDYTRLTGQGRIYPIGYCAGWSDPREWTKVLPVEMREQEYTRLAPFEGHYHTDGHATAEEARECYKRFLLDTKLGFNRWEHDTLPGALHICEEPACTEYTAHQASIGGHMLLWHLCEAHLTREVVEGLLVVGESFHS